MRARAGRRGGPEQVDIPNGSGTLHAELYKPDGDGPFPTVIALHGCGGLGGRSEPVLPHYRDWAEQLVKDGKAVLLPDSYGSRGLGPQCRVKERRISGRRERVADIVAARRWLAKQAWVMPDRVSLLGWANGAQRAALGGASATAPRTSSRISAPRSRSIRIAARPRGLGWSARVPTLVLIGGKDDVTSPPACRQMIDGARGRSALDADRGLSRRLSRFRPRQPAAAAIAGPPTRRRPSVAMSAPIPTRAPMR